MEGRLQPSASVMDVSTTPSDDEIVRLLRMDGVDGRGRGARGLLERHGGKVKAAMTRRFKLMSEHDIDELIHDGVLRVADRIETFDPARGSLGPWFSRIVWNSGLDQVRAEKARPLLNLLDPEILGRQARRENGTHSERTEALLGALRGCIERLSDLQREVILSWLAQDYTDDQELGDRLGSTPEVIRQSRFKARKRLAILLNKAIQ